MRVQAAPELGHRARHQGSSHPPLPGPAAGAPSAAAAGRRGGHRCSCHQACCRTPAARRGMGQRFVQHARVQNSSLYRGGAKNRGREAAACPEQARGAPRRCLPARSQPGPPRGAAAAPPLPWAAARCSAGLGRSAAPGAGKTARWGGEWTAAAAAQLGSSAVHATCSPTCTSLPYRHEGQAAALLSAAAAPPRFLHIRSPLACMGRGSRRRLSPQGGDTSPVAAAHHPTAACQPLPRLMAPSTCHCW